MLFFAIDPTHFSLVLVVVEGEWVGCVGDGVKKQEVTARPRETHLQPEIPSSSLLPPPSLPTHQTQQKQRQKSATVLFPQWPTFIPYQGATASTPHTHAHTQSHTAVSQSLSRRLFFFCFLSFFSLFWGFLLLL